MILLAAALSGCAGGDTETVTVTKAAPVTSTLGQPATAEPPRAGDPEPAMAFVNENAARAKHSWAQSPVNMAARFLSIVASDARTLTVTQATAEPGDRTTVTAVQDGLLDDSVRAIRYELELVRQPDGTWRIDTVRRTTRCQPGRGHQDFGPALCV